MSIIDQLGTFRSIICLNGQLPSRKLLLSLKLPIIAVDGASKRLYQLGVEPKLIIGDLDSDNRKLFPKVERIYTPDQNYSDFQKAIEYLGKSGLMPAIVTGIAGGYIDHILCNISIFSETNCIFITDNEIGFTRNYNFKLNLEKDRKISIIGCPSATVSSRGLKWELNNLRLDIFGFNSLSNRVDSDILELDILCGKVLVILYICQVIDNGLL
jgi:thiamine pyrophosphokinase